MSEQPSDRLKQAVLRYRRAEASVAKARNKMYDAILLDLSSGVRQTDVVRATGLTRERIRQIVKAAEQRKLERSDRDS